MSALPKIEKEIQETENYIIRDKLQELVDGYAQSHKREPEILTRYRIIEKKEVLMKTHRIGSIGYH